MARRKRARPFAWFTTGRVVAVLLCVALAIAGRAWLAENPQHNPWAPLDLRDPPGWATGTKLGGLRGDVAACHAVLERSGIAFTALPPTGEAACARPDRLTSAALPLAPAAPEMTCPVAVGLVLWLEHGVQPLAMEAFDSRIARIEHLGTYNCRRMYNAPDAPWSEHATGNAIDIAAFVLEDGRRISVLEDWPDEGEKARFLRDARDAACPAFGAVLSPDYNAAHADHLHLDHGRNRAIGTCR
ncbi:extensin-like domain-containing protein [Erythrobacter sp. EC-HK427]|uniref:extensin-like domain-containing protein n=1 Tax=Erythrobacter sp. EC-HK427 TaxID=2038396 RepID=UPI001254BF2C|nr:extensin family protein [Erythrobacter sp. EC-HK427]VVT14760.1 Extensin [Erythrobacter sp. EC-HK427]